MSYPKDWLNRRDGKPDCPTCDGRGYYPDAFCLARTPPGPEIVVCECQSMKLFLLQGDPGVYDSYNGHLVRARNEQEARDLCTYADEGPDWWQSDKIDVTEILMDGPSTVILSSFRAG